MLEPIKIKAACKDYLWGGTKLKTEFNKESDLEKVAESWELSAHKDGLSIITNGEEAGKDFLTYLSDAKTNVIGTKAEKENVLPILIKLIDAKENLSIQVHPSDEYAWENENDNGKTEMWIILENEPGACLYYGLKEDLTKDELRLKCIDGSIMESLNKVEVHPGDIFFIKPGTIHAIGAGIVLIEIQQTSNVTYRLYDYHRKDKDGNMRKLHLDKGVEVTNVNKVTAYTKPDVVLVDEEGLKVSKLRSCKYFTTYRYTSKKPVTFTISQESFIAYSFINGAGTLSYDDQSMDVKKGETIFVPAQEGKITIDGDVDFIATTL